YLHAGITKARIVNHRGREDMRVAHGEALGVAKLVTGGWTSRQIVTVWRSAEREEVVARTCRVLFAVATEDRVPGSDAMVDANVVTVNVRMLFAVSRKVTAGTRQVWQRERIDVRERERR